MSIGAFMLLGGLGFRVHALEAFRHRRFEVDAEETVRTAR